MTNLTEIERQAALKAARSNGSAFVFVAGGVVTAHVHRKAVDAVFEYRAGGRVVSRDVLEEVMYG